MTKTGIDRRPVTVVVARHARAGAEKEFESALLAVTEAARGFEGHAGAALLRPSTETAGRYVVVFHFTDDAALNAWMTSDRRGRLLAEADRYSDEAPYVISDDGAASDLWLTLPPPVTASRPTPGAPPRWKAAVAVWLGIFPLLMLMNLLVVPHLDGIPAPLRPLPVSIAMVALMTYAALPLVHKALRGWLTKP